jgi:hypothetical protein
MAEKAYELTDDDFNEEETVREKLSTFRRKRLADKGSILAISVSAKNLFAKKF